METGIGVTLREARIRRKVDLSEVEAATKIRIRFLRAIENEEWDVLPGGAYTRGFIRTYAGYLGLDGERLADEYRRSVPSSGGERERAPRVEPVASVRDGGPRVPGWAWIAAVSVLLIAVLVGVGLAGDGEDSTEPTPGAGAKGNGDSRLEAARTVARPGVAVRLEAEGEVWVCLLDAEGEALVDGQILEAGAEEGPFRAGGFTVAFGNGEVKMRVDGRETELPVTSSPIGYEIDADGDLRELEETERPDCA